MSRIALLDLDGTLVDSAPDIHAALDRLMASRGLPRFTRGEVVHMIGDGVRVLIERALAARGLPFDPAALEQFLPDYEAHALDLTRPFPGIPEALEALRAEGWRLAVCTNKPVQAARIVLERLGLMPLLDGLAGGDSFAVRKPDPRHLLGTLGLMGVPEGVVPPGTAMLGDHSNDIRSARGAGIAPVFCAWGYGLPEMADGAPVAERPQDLPALMARLAA
ncbi:HAD hydrolase-like protein [Roseomonas sp. OT10]|uniref:HAD hydrolase-like protein n=1 Tax=Roseomonas cutis TaxID=2897332 RepID=UPI001E54F566|nr:HAD hydrolase-like protein [Roseomonas sp. OT10]UFN50446.1 HAD hydrolase-like protein [Roseomonas sp. OT10]